MPVKAKPIDLERDEITIVLRSEESQTLEARLRLRAAAKRLLRGYGFRVVRLTVGEVEGT